MFRQITGSKVGMACAVVGCLSLVLVAPELLPRPFLGLGDARRPPFRISVDGRRAGVSWYPPVNMRRPSGQTNHFGVRYTVYTFDGNELSVPTEYLAVMAALGWVGAILVARRRERRLPDQCAKCGYDLTGNVSGVCPECGVKMQGNNGKAIAVAGGE